MREEKKIEKSKDTDRIHPAVAKRITRLRTLALFLVIWTVLLTIKLFSIQVIAGDEYAAMAKRQYERRVTLDAERGVIYDRNMNKIAVNLINYSFAADPSYMPESEKDKVAENFARVFKKSRSEYRKLLSKPGAFIWLEKRIGEADASKINDSVKGLIKMQALRRNYPYGKALASVLGMTNIDNRGSAGIELDQEETLGGKNGWAILQSDAKGRLSPNPDYPHQSSKNGKDVILTIDANYQSMAYQVLEKSVKEYDAENALAIIMNPQTGELLAMVNFPGFDPNDVKAFDPDLARNRAISDLFEPGSTFKAFSAVAALEEKLREPEDKIFCENGKMKIYGQTIHDSRKHGMMTFSEVVQKSSNIGIIKTTEKVGSEKMYQYVRAFGFGNETGIDMDGETRGELAHPSSWSGLSLPMISIGQEIGVTALQMACAYSAIANGGTLYKPYIIRAITDSNGTLSEKDAESVRTVASRETMTRAGKMLREVVEIGTGHRVKIEGIEIAGKTGTAQRIDTKTGKYSKDSFIASFAGFFPVQNPQLTFLVIFDRPRKSIWGEASAAVAARQIIEKIINSSDDFAKGINRVMAQIDHDTTAGSDIPDVQYLTAEAAQSILQKSGIPFKWNGAGDMVVGQQMAYDGALKQNIVYLKRGNSMSSDTADTPGKRIPDVRGLSARMAMNKLYEAGVEVKIKGSGYVVSQMPQAGSILKNGAVCLIQCRPDM